jgi:hypothetical protein
VRSRKKNVSALDFKADPVQNYSGEKQENFKAASKHIEHHQKSFFKITEL